VYDASERVEAATVTRVFISDCEGPISKNDNAFELTSHFVPNGDRLFTVISSYDDVLTEVARKPGHEPGSTLKLILPFLKAYGVTDEKMRKFSAQHLVCIEGIKDTLTYISSTAPAFIVSASYEHYLSALCEELGFPFENTYCTKVSLDKYGIKETEKQTLKKIAKQIIQMPVCDVPSDAQSVDDLTPEHRETIERLDEFFWKKIAEMEIGRVYYEVLPRGGREKAEAIRDVVRKLDVTMADVMYVGDSITDGDAFTLVEAKGGLTVSFNGNQYAVKNAQVAVLSENSITTSVLADAFIKFGKQETFNIVEGWNRAKLQESELNQALVRRLFKIYPERLPKVIMVTEENMEALAEESSKFRNKVRGKAVGRLG